MEKTKLKPIEIQRAEIKESNKPKNIGVIGIPHTGTFPWQTAMSLLSMRLPPDTIIKYHLVGSCLVYDARNKIIEFAEKENADWILFIDSDMVIPPDCLLKFVNAELEKKKLDMMSGIFFKRIPPYQPCFYTKARIDPKTKKSILESPIDFPETGLIECEGLGMACTFIRKKAWRAVKEKFGEMFFPFPTIGEDLSFCIRARLAGIKMFADLSIKVGHIGVVNFGKEHFFLARDEHAKNHPNEPLFKEVK